MKLVYYSLANFPEHSRDRQWIQSIRSLRMHNPSIAVWLVLFNAGSSELQREAERQNVHVHVLGEYAEFLQRTHPRGSLLAQYPTFHKFLVLRDLPLPGVNQILYLDCDTFFFDDVNLLFDRHASSDWYAREEPRSGRSKLGYDPKHVDELLLGYIARCEHLRIVPPFNSGVCLLNHEIWHSWSGLRETYLSLAWRLLCGRELGGHEFELRDPRIRLAILDAITDADRSDALPYPSANDWIIEQIALWLALGKLRHLSLGTLSPELVLQGNEFEDMPSLRRPCVVHYFSGGEESFFSSVPAIG